MKSFTYTFLVLLLSNSSFAVEIPNQFEDGQVTSASQMNENFQALKVEIEALKAQLEQSQTSPKAEFQGYSEPIRGSSGLGDLAAACDAVSTGSRICLGNELLEAPYNENFVNPQQFAWIAQKLIHANATSGNDNIRYHEFYGSTRSCWSYPKTLFVLTSSGRLSNNIPNESCYDSYPVACCKQEINMKYFTYTFLSLLLSNSIFAVEIPNQFEDGQVTSASQMNENFQALKAELEAQRALIEANLGNQKVVFQGFSAESMDGGQGLLAMQQACHNLVAGSHV